VDSAVVHLKPAPTPIPGDPDVFFTVVQSGFWGRRKPLRSALAKSPYITLKPEFKNCDFFIEHPTIRAESLSLADFFTLFEMIQPFIVATNSSRTAPI
jgi:16S rRNA A1518/A1519 N6-dimethyltransferase RsmA/KsgA/DIM1 with predicted DNA glycosylase/AP lyase activity